ncbi:MAG: glycosyl transferase [Methylococcaceae bacterium]|nr:glycosyl transferase [Methylococcaceae bacterium]
MLTRIDLVHRRGPALLAIGKPSVLALLVLNRLKGIKSVYDAMDDFPAFYKGLSRAALRSRENQLVRKVTHLLVSSTSLKDRWSKIRADVRLVHNGLDAKITPKKRSAIAGKENIVLGYVGTIGTWFDWNWVASLAEARPLDVVRLVGPVSEPCLSGLPGNIEMLPPCDHQRALRYMQEFDVGLIPFKRNPLTDSVDPIKYYEYRALGLPVVSTNFGEMAFRDGQEGIFLSHGVGDIKVLVGKALDYNPDGEAIRQFAASNSWEVRFTGTKII